MSKTLLVWEEVPEDTKMYLIPDDVAKKYRYFLDEAHGRFINHDEENDGMRFLNNALSTESTDDEGWSDEGFDQYRGIFRDYEVKLGSPITQENISHVYLSGFIL